SVTARPGRVHGAAATTHQDRGEQQEAGRRSRSHPELLVTRKLTAHYGLLSGVTPSPDRALAALARGPHLAGKGTRPCRVRLRPRRQSEICERASGPPPRPASS